MKKKNFRKVEKDPFNWEIKKTSVPWNYAIKSRTGEGLIAYKSNDPDSPEYNIPKK